MTAGMAWRKMNPLRAFRETHGYTIKELADRLEMPAGLIRRAEYSADKVPPSQWDLGKFATAMGVTDSVLRQQWLAWLAQRPKRMMEVIG